MKPEFSNVQEFIAMDGYGFYVWTAWGLAFLVIIFALLFPYLMQKKWQKRVVELEGLLKAQKAKQSQK